MDNENTTYREPQKCLARSALLQHAVDALTAQRLSSPLVTAADFDHLLEYCLRYIRTYTRGDLQESTGPVRDVWHNMHTSRVGRRDPDDLKVLYLAGPNPLNDLVELAKLGVSPFNVWAIESDKDAFRSAVKEVREAGLTIKLHLGSLHEFFAVVPEQFDIVYFDACGPLFGGKPKTSIVLRELFLHQRLAPVSALITNFAATPNDNATHWVKRLYAWYATSEVQPVQHESEIHERIVEPTTYLEHIRAHVETYYDDFVSRFTIVFSSQLLAWWRVRALPATRRAFFAEQSRLTAATSAALNAPVPTDMGALIPSIGHAQLSPSSYPYLWMTDLVSNHLPPSDGLHELFFRDTLRDAKLSEAISAISLVRNYFEGYIDWAKHNWAACSSELRKVLGGFRWFDSEGAPWYRLFCDEPLPNLIVDLLLGVYGYPYHVNIRKLRRLSYRAQETRMLSDVFIFDQCRYMYDCMPTLAVMAHELPFGLQLLLRICMDLIRRHTHYSCWDLYRGSALASIGEDGFSVHDWPEREILH